MKYLNKTFSVSYGSREYQKGWENIFGEKKNKKVLCLFWNKSNLTDNKETWSLHKTKKDADSFLNSFDKSMSVKERKWVLTTENLYNYLQNVDGLFVYENDFSDIKTV